MLYSVLGKFLKNISIYIYDYDLKIKSFQHEEVHYIHPLPALKNKGSSWRVPIYIRQKCGKIIYETKLFIPENTNEIIMNGGGGKRNELINNKELEETINYQQSIIEKLIKCFK